MVPAVELSLNDEEAAVEDTVPMVDLHIHEDVENEILTVCTRSDMHVWMWCSQVYVGGRYSVARGHSD